MSARAWAAFATVSTLWGIPYLFIKIAVDDGVPPAFLAFVRVALGRRRAPRPGLAGRHAGHAARPRALAGGLRAVRDRRALPAHRGGRAARRLVAGGHHHRRRPALRRAAGAALRPGRARDRVAARRPRRRAGRRRGAGRHRRRRARRRAARPPARSCVAAVGYAAGPMVFKRTLADLDPRAAMGASLVDRRRRPRAARRVRSARAPCPPRGRSSRWSCSASSAPRRPSSSSACSSPRSAPGAGSSSPTSRPSSR